MTDKAAKPDPRERLLELLGADSTNFLGTGLTLAEFIRLHTAEQVAASWALQPKAEKQRRLRAITQLVVELERVRATTTQSTRLAEQAIEAVIEGNWRDVAMWAEYFAFGDERPEMRERYAPVFAVFRELLLQVLRAQQTEPA